MQARIHIQRWARSWFLSYLLGMLLVAFAIAPACAGGIAGVIRDADSGVPLEGIDLDLFDSSWNAVPGADANSGADGSYLISPLPAGQYYLRADPSAADGYVDSYYPGVFLRSQALLLQVNDIGTTIVDFDLSPGHLISGFVRNAGGSPLELIDLDVYAWDGSYISSINTASAADGSYTLGCFPTGIFYVKADPSPTDYVQDRFFDSKLDLAHADPVSVVGGNVSGIDFYLPVGGNITGTLRYNGQPLSGIDIDVFDANGHFISYESATSDALGFYEVGCLEPGVYYVQADPALPLFYVDTWYGDVFDHELAMPVAIDAGLTTANVDINLPLGGSFSGTVSSASSGQPLAQVDIDVFDELGNFVAGQNATTDALGHYQVGALPSGNYLLHADADPILYYVDTYYGDVFEQNMALTAPITVGGDAAGFDINMPPGGTLSGTVTDSGSGLPVVGARMSVFDAATGGILVGVGGESDVDGHFIAGALPAGEYLLRCNGLAAQDLAFEFYPGVVFKSEATSLPVTLFADLPDIDFSLDQGGWITGRVFDMANGLPLSGVDIDVYGLDGEFVGALDAEADGAGDYLLGPAPTVSFLIKADPPVLSDYYFQYWDHAYSTNSATPVAVTAGQTQENIDFDLPLIDQVAVEDPPVVATGLREAYPNPFNPYTTLAFDLKEQGPVSLAIFDLDGRLVRMLANGSYPAGHYEVAWRGFDSRDRIVSSGVYFAKFSAAGKQDTRKLVLLR